MEQELRQYASHLAGQVADATEEVAYARDEVTLAAAEHGLAGRRHRRTATNQLTKAVAAHTTGVDGHTTAQSWITVLRDFVIAAAVPDGLLAEAAAGWQRSPEPPSFVVVFDSERDFVGADPRRAARVCWGTPVPSGIAFGDLWRRDGDDDAPGSLPRSGPWRLSCLPCTGEIYASRRCDHLPEQVWLLGSGFHDLNGTIDVLLDLEEHMREPNSLILAAQTIHTEHRRHDAWLLQALWPGL